MLNFNRNNLIRAMIGNYNETFESMLDTGSYVPDDVRKQYIEFIKKSIKATFKIINREDKIFQKKFKKQLKKVRKQINENTIENILNFYLTNKEEYETYEQKQEETNEEEDIENET